MIHEVTVTPPHATRAISATISTKRQEGLQQEVLGLWGLTLVAFCSLGDTAGLSLGVRSFLLQKGSLGNPGALLGGSLLCLLVTSHMT
jgi:hypothetical protein